MFPQLFWLGQASCNLDKFPDLINHPKLEDLDLSKNRITGEVPNWIWEIGNGKLYSLNLSSNLLVGLQKSYHVPSSLNSLDIHSNQLHGELPPLPTHAEYIDYSHNNFEKSIPLNIGNSTTKLVYLSLANNSLSGAIPTSFCNATKLQVLDLSANKLSGTIPPCLVQNLKQLGVFNFGENNISGHIPNTFGVNCSLEILDISQNYLEGSLPVSLANCKSLQVLNVGNNNIDDGTIPKSLGNLTQLESLDLSTNQLTGEIPKELTCLTFLGALNLSNNQLIGPIPSGPQLQTFSTDSFQGNTGLCGFPLNISCRHASINDDVPPPNPYQEDEAINWDYVSVAVGYVVGLGSILWLLFLC
ncbi:UNVERIFIED_CONTAM: Receptor-like protein 7 [Sesamum angustifolium]|uniref:Receptor-like protein 7 n=1 Tax=Sesamum angustifolium TaxID=2727405 RepID=A0AAW2QU14_9LAMI